MDTTLLFCLRSAPRIFLCIGENRMEWDQELQSSFWSHGRDNQAILYISTSKEPNMMHLIWCLFFS